VISWRERAGWATGLVVAVLLGRWTRPEDGELALCWPAAGVAFLWLLRARSRTERPLVDGVLLAVTTGAVNVVTGAPVVLAVALGLATTVLAGVAVTSWSRWRSGPDDALHVPRDLAALLLAALAGAVASALVGPPVAALVGDGDLLTLAAQWTVRTTTGTVVVAAVGLAWRAPAPSGHRPHPARAETAALLLGGTALAVTVLALTRGVPLSFLLVPVGVWAGLRQPTRSAALSTAALGTAVVVATLAGRGPFGGLPLAERALTSQLFLLVLTTVTLVLALHRDDRLVLLRRVLDSARRSREQTELLEAVFASTNDGIVVVDAAGRFLLHNPSAVDLLGVVPASVGPARWPLDFALETTTGEPFPVDRLPLVRALGGEVVPGADLVSRAHGGHRVLSVSARPLPEGRGAVAAFHDVTDARAAAHRVQDSRDLLQGVLDSATEQAIIAADAEGSITLFSRGAELMLGWTQEQVLGRQASLFWDPDEVAARAVELGVAPGYEVFVDAVRAGQVETRPWTFRTAGGDRLAVRLTVTALRTGPGGALAGYLGVARDVTAQLAAERALADSELRFRLAFDTAPVGLALLDLAPGRMGVVLQANEAMAALTGLPRAALPGLELTGLLHADETRVTSGVLAQLAAGEREAWSAEQRFRHPDGEVVWGRCSASVMRPDPTAPGQVVLLVEDVTARRHAEDALTHQALHDALTGLPNRSLLVDRIEQALGGLTRSHHRVGLLYLDLDGFKAVNDTAGHAAGDTLLVQVGRRLRAAVRPGDTVARLGGDEFAVLCPDVADPDDLHAVADRLLAAVSTPVPIGGRTHTVSASIGLVASGAGGSVEQLLHDADQAMYASKTAGKGRVSVHTSETETRAARTTRVLPELRRALAAGELVLYGQPVVELVTGVVVAVETLLRWQHPTRGLLLPAEFIDVVETSDLVLPVGRLVLTASCALAAGWTAQLGPAAPDVHVNVSGRQLEEGDLTADVLAALEATGLPADKLVLELTETHVPALADSMRRDLDRLRARGVRLALDDVGTGWSSLVRLTELPVDTLKVDRLFVAGLGVDPACEAVVRAVLGMSTALGVDVVAEGVETADQHEWLRRAGCATAQGHLYSPALPGAELLAALGAAGATPLENGTAVGR